MGVKVIRSDDLAVEITAALEEFSGATLDICDRAVDAVAKETRDEIKKNIDKQKLIKTGEYRKSWKIKREISNLRPRAVVYSTRPMLPHLLEFGHAKRTGGRVDGREHIYPAERSAKEKLVAYIKRGIESGGD